MALLPFAVLYFLSDILSFIIQHIIAYRKDVIFRNLRISFPDMNETEIKKTAGKFYRNLSDLFVEVIKSQKMSRKQLDKRVVFKNQEVLEHKLFDEGKNVFVLLGHYGNWEWTGNKIATFLRHDGGAIYKPLRDKFFDDYMVHQRQKYKGTLMIEYKNAFRTLLGLRDRLMSVFVLADQSPVKTEMDYFVNFLGQKTAFYNGVDRAARALNYAVLYLDIQRVKRGYYEVEIKIITRTTSELAEEEITKTYVQLLEKTIRKSPDNWLWSHRRWKTMEDIN